MRVINRENIMIKRIALVIILTLLTSNAIAATGYWTGEFVRWDDGSTNIATWGCGYSVNGKIYFRVMENYCESTAEIN